MTDGGCLMARSLRFRSKGKPVRPRGRFLGIIESAAPARPLPAGFPLPTLRAARLARKRRPGGDGAPGQVSARDFQKVARQKLDAACEIADNLGLNLLAQYVGGYTVECSLKALFVERTPPGDRPDVLRRLTSGATMHKAEVLVQILRDGGLSLPLELTKRLRRFDWNTALRYETGRGDTGETNGLLKTAGYIHDRVERQLT